MGGNPEAPPLDRDNRGSSRERRRETARGWAPGRHPACLPEPGRESRSRDELTLLELGALPGPAFEDSLQDHGRVPDVDVAKVERSEAEPQDVRGAEIADDVLGNEGLHDGITLRVAKRDLTAPLSGIPGTRRSESEVLAPFFHETKEQVAHLSRFRANLRLAGASHDLDSDLEGRHPQDRRRSAEMSFDSRRGSIVGIEREGRLVSHPSRERRPDRILVLFGDVEKRRGSRSSVQVLVPAADGEIDIVAIEMKRNRE